MDYFHKLKRQIQIYIFCGLAIVAGASTTSLWYGLEQLEWAPLHAAGLAAVVALLLSSTLAVYLSQTVLQPLSAVWRAVLHIDPGHHDTPAPNLNDLRIGRELVTNLTLQIYQFASNESSKDLVDHRLEISQAANIVRYLPLPLFVFNKELLVTNTSDLAREFCRVNSSELLGRPLFDSLHLEFSSNNTLEQWVNDCQSEKVTDTAYWERVRVLSKDDNSLLHQCDIAAYYNKDNPSGTEFIITLFDRTERYTVDDNSLGFVAMAVHELRTPITMLRGYIEVLEEELSDKLDAELKSYLLKMESSAKHLSAVVGNILNVARIEQNQLTLHLTEQAWPEVLKNAAADAELRAQIHGKSIEYTVAPGLPTVAIDQVSINEVINNLLENAIKYSGESTRIVITSGLNKDGLVETTVQDFGMGIPTSVLPSLFEKFSRNHRTRSEVSGTGLGLYLCKAIVAAHGGQIYASSKEGQGSTFGFTLLPYAQLSTDQRESADKDITRHAHGWIKNHSLYRR